MNEATRLALWLELLQAQSLGMSLAAAAGLFVVFAGASVGSIWPKSGRWLPWLGVGVFYATMAILQFVVSGRPGP